MKPIVLTVDENQILDAAIQAAAATIGSTVMNRKNCDVTFKKGRKTANNPEPGLEVTVEFYPQGKPGAVVSEAAPVKEEVVSQEKAPEVVEEEVAPETTPVETETPKEKTKLFTN